MDGTRCARALIAVLAGSMFGCAASAPPPPDDFVPAPLRAAAFTPKVESFVVVLDASSSMADEQHAEMDKLVLAKRTVAHLNQTLPMLGYRAGLVAFGSGRCVDHQDAKSFYGMTAYDPGGLDDGLDAVACAGGTTPMHAGLELAAEMLEGTTGSVAVLLVSDGRPLKEEKARVAAQQLKAAFGDGLCIYPVQVGTDPRGAALLEDIATIGGCGYATNADALASPEAMAEYVAGVFLVPAVVRAPAPRFSTTPVVAGDSDRDGVRDGLDRCPRTPTGVRVNAAGCWEFAGLHFAFGSAAIANPASLDEVVRILEARPEITGEVRGYTDSIGSAAYNQQLSQARAAAVRAYLIGRGIDPARIRAVGRGMRDPVASNDSEAGRALNRRVELEPDP